MDEGVEMLRCGRVQLQGTVWEGSVRLHPGEGWCHRACEGMEACSAA